MLLSLTGKLVNETKGNRNRIQILKVDPNTLVTIEFPIS